MLRDKEEWLAERLSELKQLTSLILLGNLIDDAGASSLSTLSQLKSLNLGWNQIGNAGAASLSVLRQLSSLDLRYNLISDRGAASLSTLSRLTSLNLSYNHIGDGGVESLAALSHLTSLNLAGNEIRDAGAASLSALFQLTSLQLRDNMIGDDGVASLAGLTQLTSLDLDGNPVQDATSLARLHRLEFLGLAHTRVQDLSPLRSLLERGLKATWEEFSLNSGINVYDCPLIHPPPEIIRQGQEAILNYLLEIDRQGLNHLYEAKLLILGRGGAGKTSLLRRLYQPNLEIPAEEESTKGIDIHSQEVITSSGKCLRLNVWDFGDQQIYYATHQFFLTKRSLYILVDDTKTNDTSVHDEGFNDPLLTIEVLSDKSPVLIFQNEKAGRSKTIDEAGIKARFANVKEFYPGISYVRML